MRPLFLVCGLVMLLAVSACDTSNEDPLPPLVPQIQEGDMWIMNRETRISPTYPEPPISESSVIDTFVVKESRLVNGRTWFNIESQRFGNGLFSVYTISGQFYSFREDGVWQLDDDDQEIHIIRYPAEQKEEFNFTEGIFSRLVNPDTLYTLPELGSVEAIKFENRFSMEFKPFSRAGEPFEYQDMPLGQEVITTNYYSGELGVLRHEAFYVSAADAPVSARFVGTLTWSLVAYIPASAQ